MRISIKYKLLLVFLFLVVSGISTYFFITRRTFLEDKKLFVLDWSLATLKASSNEIKYEIKSRLESLQLFLPKLYLNPSYASLDNPQLLSALSENISREVYSVTFYQKSGGQFQPTRSYINHKLLQSLQIPEDSLAPLQKLSIEDFPIEQNISSSVLLQNRSLILKDSHTIPQLPILTLILKGSFFNSSNSQTLITVDLNPDFLQASLKQSELAELFVFGAQSGLISHPKKDLLFNWKSSPLTQILSEKLKKSVLPRETIEVDLEGVPQLLTFSSLGIGDLYLISKIKKEDAFQALNTLAIQSLQVGLFIISLAFVLSIVFSKKLTENIEKLEVAAREVGAGNLDIKLNIQSHDEIQKVANTFEWMTGRIVTLLKETAEKARMEEELATASLIQKTILTPPTLNIEGTEVIPFYKSATECGGDLWDVFVRHNKLTVLLGDATGHGAPAAIVTAVVKSCVSTLNTFHQNELLTPSEILKRINTIVHQSCKGELLMTMSVVQLDLESGLLTLANAGHEAPLHLKSEAQKKPRAEALFVRGERLGFNAESQYESLNIQLNPGDTILIYSDGISEAQNQSGEQWGERALRKVLSSHFDKPLQEIKDALLTALDSFTGKVTQKDDITFVLFGWKKQKMQLNNKAA